MACKAAEYVGVVFTDGLSLQSDNRLAIDLRPQFVF